jgi:acylphosphatase
VGLCAFRQLCYYGAMNHESQSDRNDTQELLATVRGRVQGVGFRYYVVERASALGLRGYARNQRNGNVEVLAQGPRPALERLLTLLRQGPAAAHVQDVQITWRQPTEHISGFHVRW